MRVCSVCRAKKLASEFYGTHSRCKECHKERVKIWSRKNRKRSRHNKRKNKLKTRYGITYDEFLEMAKSQGEKCGICSRAVVPLTSFCVDHLRDRQESGQPKYLPYEQAKKVRKPKVRGLLCRRCNMGLGLFFDDSVLLRKASQYLEKFL